ncbi:MAG TPA: HAMP domain-containing sensor histidine kinase, partial [Rhizomicrobium sp.]|nr:HAMP domain-containing sensor histidine kinase [Rhizomicrobium sp.]
TWVSTAVLVMWFVIVVISVIPLAAVTYEFARRAPTDNDRRKWTLFAAGAYAIFTVGWSSLAFVFWTQGSDLNHMLIVLLVACTLAGNTALIAPSRPLLWVSFVVYGATLVAAPLQSGGLIYGGLSAAAVLYVGYLYLMARQLHATARDMLLLRDDKNDLIDALAKSKEESDEARDRAEAASRSKSQFLANMSHELRTPLNAILGFSEMIYAGINRNPQSQLEYAKIIHESGSHLLTLINDILDLAKIEAGGFVLREQDIDLGSLLEKCSQIVALKAEDGRVKIRNHIPSGLPHVVADERALRQIQLNLLSNAVKFTPPGGSVTAFAHIASDGAVAFGVSDNGLGIAPDDHQRVFQNFGQGRHDIVTADKGTGLGLPIAKGLAEAHGGRIHLDSGIGEGTTVTVYLPASRASTPALEALAS